MRFRLTLELTDPGCNLLPFNYRYELSAWIYRLFNHSDPGFSSWLHNHGYTDESKKFKFFTFSGLIIPKLRPQGDRLAILCTEVSLIISVLPETIAGHLITGLFRDQSFLLGDKITQVPFKVKNVEGLPEPNFSGRMEFTSLAPILISFLFPGDRYATYLSPEAEGYPVLFFRNLKEKYKTYFKKDFPFVEKEGILEVMSSPKKKGILIKAGTPFESKLIGYEYHFRITAPPELIRLGYYTGFGEKNSLGFGCGEVRSKKTE